MANFLRNLRDDLKDTLGNIRRSVDLSDSPQLQRVAQNIQRTPQRVQRTTSVAKPLFKLSSTAVREGITRPTLRDKTGIGGQPLRPLGDTASSVKDFVRTTAQQTPRLLESTYRWSEGLDTLQPKTKQEVSMFGKQPIQPVDKRIGSGDIFGTGESFNIPKTVSVPLAAGMVGLEAFDLATPGVQEGKIAKEFGEEALEKYGRYSDDDLIKLVAQGKAEFDKTSGLVKRLAKDERNRINIGRLSKEAREAVAPVGNLDELLSGLKKGKEPIDDIINKVRARDFSGRVQPEDLVPGGKSEAFGALAGVEPQFDEEGNLTGFNYNTKKGALGIIGAGVVKNLDPETVSTLARSIDDIPDVKTKVNALDYLKTPKNVLDRIGLGKVADNINMAHEGYLAAKRQEIAKVADWVKQVPSRESNVKIFRNLDGRLADDVLTPQELKVANEIKDYLKGWADRLGLPEDKRVSDYITHIFEKDFIKKEFDPALARIITDKVPSGVYNPFTEKRLGKLGYIEDTWRALDAYVKRATRQVNMEPALKQLKEASENVGPETYKYLQRYASRINLRPTEIDNLIDNFIKSSPIGYKLGQRPIAAITGSVRQMIYRATLGLNPSSAIRNLAQVSNTYAKLGEEYTYRGYAELAQRAATKNLDELVQQNILSDKLIDDYLRATESFRQKLTRQMDEVLFAMFNQGETINRGSAYFGAKQKFLDEGKSLEDAIRLAKDVVEDTQFKFGSVSTPVGLSSDIASAAATLQTYGVKQAEFLIDMLKSKDFKGLLRYFGSSALIYATVGKALGWRPSSIIPTFNLSGGPIAEVGRAAGQYGLGVLEDDDYLKRKGAGRIFSLTVPSGSQIRKTAQGTSALSAGGIIEGGKLRFPVEADRKLRIAIFGPYSGSDIPDIYYDNELSPLTQRQTLEWQARVDKGEDPVAVWADIYQKRIAGGTEQSLKNILYNLDLNETPKDRQKDVKKQLDKRVDIYKKLEKLKQERINK